MVIVAIAAAIVLGGALGFILGGALGRSSGLEDGRAQERREWEAVMERARELEHEGAEFHLAVDTLRGVYGK